MNDKSGIFASPRLSTSVFVDEVVHELPDSGKLAATSWSTVGLLRCCCLNHRLYLCAEFLHLNTKSSTLQSGKSE